MKRLVLCTFIVVAFAMQAVFAQQTAGSKVNSADRLSDDDGGMVQIVPVDVAATSPIKPRVAPATKSVRQVSIFLGTGWAEQNSRARERTLSDLSDKLGELRNSNITVLPAAPSVEDFADLSKKPVNDLGIQRKLNEMLASKAIPSPEPGTVYMVFLAPGIKSSVGGHTAGIDYAAYHTTIHIETTEVRYVVVPFNENAERQAAAASRALMETAVSPGP